MHVEEGITLQCKQAPRKRPPEKEKVPFSAHDAAGAAYARHGGGLDGGALEPVPVDREPGGEPDPYLGGHLVVVARCKPGIAISYTSSTKVVDKLLVDVLMNFLGGKTSARNVREIAELRMCARMIG